jgi:hypothetical protein
MYMASKVASTTRVKLLLYIFITLQPSTAKCPKLWTPLLTINVFSDYQLFIITGNLTWVLIIYAIFN